MMSNGNSISLVVVVGVGEEAEKSKAVNISLGGVLKEEEGETHRRRGTLFNRVVFLNQFHVIR